VPLTAMAGSPAEVPVRHRRGVARLPTDECQQPRCRISHLEATLSVVPELRPVYHPEAEHDCQQLLHSSTGSQWVRHSLIMSIARITLWNLGHISDG